MPRKTPRKSASAKKKTVRAARSKPSSSQKSAPKKTRRKTVRVVKNGKSPYTKTELKVFRELLIRRRAILRGDVDTLKAEGLRADGDGELSSVPLHLADLGSDAYEQEMTLGLMESESDELQEIDEALERIDEGTYGVCEECEGGIPKMRLKAIPYTRHCITCQEKTEEY